MKRVLVTGANRGIGLEICRQLFKKDNEVYAVCRRSSEELAGVGCHVIEDINLTQENSFERLRSSLQTEQLDMVINCAGIYESTSWDDVDFEVVQRQIIVNAIAPLKVVKAIEDRIVDGGKIVMITSRMGSIEDNTSGGTYGYRMSKAALNIASVSLAIDLKSRKIAVGIIHPGYVKTAMTGYSGYIDPTESASGIIQRIEELNMKNTGTFWHQNGEILPW